MSDLGHRTDSPWERTQPGMATSAPGPSLRVAPGRHIDARLLSGGAGVLGWGASSLGLPLTREGHSLRPQFFYLYGEELVLSKERNAATRMSGMGGAQEAGRGPLSPAGCSEYGAAPHHPPQQQLQTWAWSQRPSWRKEPKESGGIGDAPPSLMGLEASRQAQDTEDREPLSCLTCCHLRPAGGSSDHA